MIINQISYIYKPRLLHCPDSKNMTPKCFARLCYPGSTIFFHHKS